MNPNTLESAEEFGEPKSPKIQHDYVVFNYHGRSRYSKNRGNCPKCKKGKLG